MSNYFYAGHQQQQQQQQQPHQPQQHHTQNPHPLAVNNGANHPHGRSRRSMRMASSQPGNRQYRHQQKIAREPIITEPASMTAFRARFEAGRSFDLDDDLEFCPVNLLTFDEVGLPTSSRVYLNDYADMDQRQSVTSGSSDRSSLGSTSPDSSPLQAQIQPQITPAMSMASAYVPPPTSINATQQMRLHQPAALRGKNVIPIVNPSTGTRIASPPSSVSPGILASAATIRRW